MLTVVLSSAAALATIMLIARARKAGRSIPVAPTGITQALFIDSEHGRISEMLVDGNEEIYAGILGCSSARVGISGNGFIVYVDPGQNGIGQSTDSTGFRITSDNSVEFRGNGLIVGNSTLSGKLRVELIVKDREQHPVYEIGVAETELAAVS